jgi:AhpD family alkylhydroperoxidase
MVLLHAPSKGVVNSVVEVTLREVVALAVGNADACNYCQAAHTVEARLRA